MTKNNTSTLQKSLSQNFKESLEDVGLGLFHPAQSQANIENLFVYPELKMIRSLREEVLPIMKGNDLLPSLSINERWIIFGDEQSGKTAYAKKLFLDAFNLGYTPILLDGKSIKTSNVDKLVKNICQGTYPDVEIEEISNRSDLVCIIDDFSEITLNQRSLRRLLENVHSKFNRVILLAADHLNYHISDYPEIDNYEKSQILPFGHLCRGKLIEEWVNLELGEEVSETQYWRRRDELRIHVDTLVRKNIVPAKPVYILMILQSFNLVKSRSLELTSYGHCYQYLIYQSLDRARVKQSDVDQYLNFLSELGREILESSSEVLSEDELEIFFEKYLKKFVTSNKDKMVDDLVRASILENRDGYLYFRYRYLFYFFASKNIAETLHRGGSAKATIADLIETIHLEKSSNIIIFLSHHSKDPWILEKILSSIDIFPREKEASLETDSLGFMKKFVDSIPEIVIESRDANQERRRRDIAKDAFEREQETANSRDEEVKQISEAEEELYLFVRKIEKVFRITEVCGQILRNRIGSIERETLELLYSESVTALLKFLNIILKSREYLQEEGIREIQNTLEKTPGVTDEEVSKQARKFYMGLNYAIIFGVLGKVSFSLGSNMGKEIYEAVAERKDTAAIKLIQRLMELQFHKQLNHREITKLHRAFISSKNLVCDRLLKMIVVNHFYMHDVSHSEKQKLASALDIPLTPLRIMESRKKWQSST